MLLILNSGVGVCAILELLNTDCCSMCLELSIQWPVGKLPRPLRDLKDLPFPQSAHLVCAGKCLAVLSLGKNYVCKCTYMCNKCFC